MPEFTVRIDEAVATTIQEDARRRNVTVEECAAQILAAHHNEFLRFPDGVLREGRKKLIDLLGQIPCLRNFSSSGIDFRYWWVSFQVDEASPIASVVIRKLAFLLNSESEEMLLPTVLKPVPDEAPDVPMRWVIISTVPRLNPADVERWLRDNLPRPLAEETAWLPGSSDCDPGSNAQLCSVRSLPELVDCEKAGRKHKWFNLDDIHSGCYDCQVVKEGQLWK